MVRNIRHAHLLENELLEVIVRFLSPHAVGVANHRGDSVNDRFRNSASNFGREPAEVVSLLRAEGDRVIAVVVNPIAGPDLTILAVARWNVISFWLWEELPNRRFQAHKVTKCDWFQNRVKLAGIRAEGCSEARAIGAVLEKMQTKTSLPVACLSPQNSSMVPHSPEDASDTAEHGSENSRFKSRPLFRPLFTRFAGVGRRSAKPRVDGPKLQRSVASRTRILDEDMRKTSWNTFRLPSRIGRESSETSSSFTSSKVSIPMRLQWSHASP